MRPLPCVTFSFFRLVYLLVSKILFKVWTITELADCTVPRSISSAVASIRFESALMKIEPVNPYVLSNCALFFLGVEAHLDRLFLKITQVSSTSYLIEALWYSSNPIIFLGCENPLAKAYELHILSIQVSKVVFPVPLEPTSK